MNTVFVAGIAKIPVISLAESPDIHVKHRDIDVRSRFFGENRFFDGVHAAGGRTVIPLQFPRPDTLKESKACRNLFVRRPFKNAAGRTCRAENSLHFNTGNNIVKTSVSVFGCFTRIEFVEPGRENNRPDVYLNCFRNGIEMNCVIRTDIGA